MLFVIRIVDSSGRKRKLVYTHDALEEGFDIVNRMVTDKHNLLADYTLQQVLVYDDGRVTCLPLQAFDGTTYVPALKELEREWQALLMKPLRGRPRELHQRLAHYEDQLVQIEQQQTHLDLQLGEVEKITHSLSRKEAILNHHRLAKASYERQAQKIRLLRDRLLNRLYGLSSGSPTGRERGDDQTR